MRPSGHLFAIICAIGLGAYGARAAGVAILKEQVYHRDSTAMAVAYSRIIDSHGPYLRIVSSGTNVDITRSKLIERIELPDSIPESIHEEQDVAEMRQTLADLRRFTTRYPRSKPLLEMTIARLAGHVGRFDAGDVRFEGDWISRKTYTGIQESIQREMEAHNLAEVEKRIFEAAQRDKGLVLHDGKWITKQMFAERSPDSSTELSECVAPVWNGELQGARFAVDNLTRLASTQTGAPKVRTERLATAVRNLFLAEAKLTQQTIAGAGLAHTAAAHDKNAKKWLKPNAFGTINEDAARASRAKATQIRKQAAAELDSCRQGLLNQLHETEIVSLDFKNIQEFRVARVLHAATRAVAARHFSDDEFTPASPDASQVSNSKPPLSVPPAEVDVFK